MSTVAHNERLARRRNAKRLAALAAEAQPCGYCGTPTRNANGLCERDQRLDGAYREDDDRQRETNDEGF